MKHTVGALLGALLAVSAHAQVTPLIEAETILDYGATQEWQFTPAAGCNSIRLAISARMDFPRATGSTYVLGLFVNDRPIDPNINRRQNRLLNKPLIFTMASGMTLGWHRDGLWRIVYSPDFETVQSPAAGGMQIPDVDPYELVLDITDFVKRGESNALRIEHRGEAINLRKAFEGEPSLHFAIRRLQVECSDAAPRTGGDARPATTPDTLMVDPPQPPDVRATCSIGKHGLLTMKLPGGDINLSTRLSYPGGGVNVIGARADERTEPGFAVELEQGNHQARITATGKAYRLVRSVKLLADHVEISDTFTNLRDEVIGIKYDNRLQAATGAVVDAFIGGDRDCGRVEMKSMENTSLYLATEEAGCGMVALDDVYRHHAYIYYADDGGGIRSDHFGLAPGGSYTFEFNVYPTRRPSYWDMINLARRDMDVNFTIPGGFSFFLPETLLRGTKESLDEWTGIRGVDILSSGVWFDYSENAQKKCYHGTDMLNAVGPRELLRQSSTLIRERHPDMKWLIYIHSSINTDEAAPGAYPDARVMTQAGEQYINPSYTQRIGVPFYYFYMTPENGYLEAMKRVVDMCVDEDKLNAHGCYWDEMAMVSVPYTYDRWDGYSVEIDEHGEVGRKFAYVQLISLQAKRELAEYILDRGMLIGNSAPMSKTMTQLHFPRFVETASGWYPARTHLYSPISLGDHHTVKDWASQIVDIRKKLEYGTLYYYYSRVEQPEPTLTQQMFPFTPVELHAGWVLGRERIVTMLPGTYTFGDDAPVSVYAYSAEGGPVESKHTERVEDGRRLVRLDLHEGEMAVVVKADGR